MYIINKITDVPIVIVYLNNKVPKYAKKNIQYLSKTFTNKKIVLISNIEENKDALPRCENTEFYLLTNFDQELSILTFESELPSDFRNGFWISTIARFKALEIFMRQEGVKSALHIEADVLLLENFPFECEAFQTPKLAFPYVSEPKAAASIFFVGDISALIHFNNFIQTSIRREPSITDMQILAKYGEVNKDKVIRLFSGFGNYENPCRQHIFDAATFGMYLTGQDPRNSRGFVKTYFDIDDHAVKPSQIDFKYLSEKGALVNLGSKDYVLTSLHIHSKQRKYFSYKKSKKLVLKAITRSSKEQRVTFSMETWMGLVAKYLERRIRNRR